MTRPCATTDCDSSTVARGLCAKHYQSAKAKGVLPDVDETIHRLSDADEDSRTATCSVCGPGVPYYGEGGRKTCLLRVRRYQKARRLRVAKTEEYRSYNRLYARRRLLGANTNDAVQLALESVDHQCEICSEPLTLSTARFDHDHGCCPRSQRTCGECFRGILCNNCNALLGLAKDDVQRLARAASYLTRDRSLIPLRDKPEILVGR